MTSALLCCQVLLTFVCEGEGPVRFGFPLPAGALVRGLRLGEAGARLQWRPLHERPDPVTGRVWVELAVVGAEGPVQVLVGGVGPAEEAGGAVVRVEAGREPEPFPGGELRRRRWRWCTGEEDELERITFLRASVHEGEAFDAGESLTRPSADLDARWLRVRIDPRQWARAGVLPPDGGAARAWRARLAAVGASLRELPGLRGRGDYARSNDVVTNLEFDTTFGFARLGLANGDAGLLRRALDSARHLADRDLDPRSGLPFRHGAGHRVVPPEPGHAWLQGLLLAGCLSGDDGLIAAAGSIARGLARHPPAGQGRDERARDFGWPLLELEAWLRFADDGSCRRAADALALELRRRFDAENRVVRFGEGECRGGFYEERPWLTGGIILPALRAHALRQGAGAFADVIEALERRLLALVREGKPGLPVRYWVRDGRISGQIRLQGVPEAFLLLEGLPADALASCLRRSTVARALRDVPAHADPDVATSFSIAARCDWVFR